MDTKNKIFVVIGSIALVATTAVGGYALFATKDTSAAVQTSQTTNTANVPASSTVASVDTSAGTASTSSTPTSSSTATTATSGYKDGTYTANTNYSVPHGAVNSLSATIVIAGGKITSVKTTDNYSDRESSMYIRSFESSVSSDANSQDIASYSPSRIGGASLTSSAFSDVVDAIRAQAKA